MTRRLGLFGLIALSAMGTLSVAHAQIDLNATIAVVNGKEIKYGDYYRRMEMLEGVRKTGQNIDMPPGFLTLDAMLTESIVLQLATEKGAAPTDVEIANETAKRLKRQPDLLEKWKATGRTEEELRGKIRYELTQFKLQTLGVTVTDAEIDQYVKDDPAVLATPAMYTLRIIVVESAIDKLAVDDQLKKGTTFAKVAESLSIDESKSRGGAFGTFPLQLLPEGLRKVVQGKTKGQVTDWFPFDKYQGKILVEDLKPESKKTLTPELRADLKIELMLFKGRIKNNLPKMVSEARQKAVVDIKRPEFAQLYSDLVKFAGKGG